MSLGPEPIAHSRFGSSMKLALSRPSACKPTATRTLPRDPVFLTPRNFFRASWVDLFGSLFQHYPVGRTQKVRCLFQSIPLLRRRVALAPFSAAFVIHLLAIPLLPLFLRWVPRPQEHARLEQQDIVYYHFGKLDTPKFPRVLAKGPGGRPGSSQASDRVPPAGASKSLDQLFAISHPRVPDNNHQTILQSKSLADLKIKTDIPLPNLMVAGPSAPKRPLEFSTNQVRPRQPSVHTLPSDPPALTQIPATPPTNAMLGASLPQAHLPVPLGGASVPVHARSSKSYAGAGDVPEIQGVPGGGTGDGGSSLLVLGLNPNASAQEVALPPGNRYGEFSVSSPRAGSGSPGGVANGLPGGGNATGNGVGGDASTGVGNGNSGGGGRNGSDGFVSLHGDSESNSGLGDPGTAAVQLVFAIPNSVLLRHNKLVVSAGPIGGGGSAAYGVLPCGKIYTVFLATAQKQWSLQYCQKSQPPGSSVNRTPSTVIRTEPPILPPEAELRFDFKRFPLPPEKSSKSILIRGALTAEGKPEDLEVYQGLLSVMDSAALAAFRQWTFKPALRAGKPVRVEILLSIPMN